MTPEEQKQFDDLKAAHDGYNAANLKNQQALDEALQKIQDQAAAHAKAIDDLKEQHAAEITAALARQAEELAKQHAEEIADLKEKTLIPALKDLQARQAADLAAKHKAELANL